MNSDASMVKNQLFISFSSHALSFSPANTVSLSTLSTYLSHLGSVFLGNATLQLAISSYFLVGLIDPQLNLNGYIGTVCKMGPGSLKRNLLLPFMTFFRGL